MSSEHDEGDDVLEFGDPEQHRFLSGKTFLPGGRRGRLLAAAGTLAVGIPLAAGAVVLHGGGHASAGTSSKLTATPMIITGNAGHTLQELTAKTNLRLTEEGLVVTVNPRAETTRVTIARPCEPRGG